MRGPKAKRDAKEIEPRKAGSRETGSREAEPRGVDCKAIDRREATSGAGHRRDSGYRKKRTREPAPIVRYLRGGAALCLGLSLLSGCVSNSSQITKPQPERAAEINLHLATDHLRKGNLQQAKDKIDRSLQQNPRDGQAHSVAALLYGRLGDADKADMHYQRAISLMPQDPQIKNNYSAHLCQRDRYARGEKLALEAAENPLYKTPEFGFLNAGNCARNAGDMARAEQHYRRALQIRPRFDEALMQMAELEYQQQQYLSARAFLERYLAVSKTSPASLWLGVRIERGLGNEPQARQYAQRLKNEHPTAAQTRELLESERNPG